MGLLSDLFLCRADQVADLDIEESPLVMRDPRVEGIELKGILDVQLSIMWATAQGQLPIGSMNPAGGVAPVPPYALAVRLVPDAKDRDIFLAAGASGAGAVYTDSGKAIQIVRKILVRVSAKLDWLILKLH